MAKNGQATYSRTGRFVDLTHMPNPKVEQVLTFAELRGGLNTYALDQDLKLSESPDLVNMRWRDGSLGCRPGQRWVDDTSYGAGHAAYEALYYGKAFFHIGTGLYYADPRVGPLTLLLDLSTVLHGASADARGTFSDTGST